MNKIKLYCVISFLLSFFLSGEVLSLVPLEGIILGKVNEDYQDHTFSQALNFGYTKGEEENEAEKLSYLFSVFKQGEALKRTCLTDPKVNYSSGWKLANAKRSVAANLQYLGLDLSLKAIVHYAKALELSDVHYNQMVTNLIYGSCSPNLTVYSRKLLLNNFENYWKQNKKHKSFLPSIAESPYFEKSIKKKHKTIEVIKKEFEYGIKNFRAFCSWNGDVENYRLLVPYLKDPYIMGLVIAEMRKKKLELNQKTKELVIVDSPSGVQVSCENLVCRRKTEQEFLDTFPRMLGANDLKDDLDALYCDHFQFIHTSLESQPENIQNWIKQRSVLSARLETLNLIALMTKIPNFSFLVDSLGSFSQMAEKNMTQRWDKWMATKLKKFNNNQLYEEPLEVKLISQVGKNEILKGQFKLHVNVGLSELDKVVMTQDKIDARLDLQFPAAFLSHIRERINFFNKKGKIEKSNEFIDKLSENIEYQLNANKKYFIVELWNKDFSEILASEILDQINQYNGKRLNLLNKEIINIPINFNFGVFALSYIYRKFNFLKFQRNALTFR